MELNNNILSNLCNEFKEYNNINPDDYKKYQVKCGLRNEDGTGVMAGLTCICNIKGYVVDDGEKVPVEGRLNYRGINLEDIVNGCINEKRFGFEEVIWLLLFGELPDKDTLEMFRGIISENRELPENFAEDMIMKAPSRNIMNKLSRSVLALYSYCDDPDNIELPNVLAQSISIIAKLPVIMAHAYQVKRRYFDQQSMFLHPLKPELSTSETILRAIRADTEFTEEEARLLDLCLMVHADHGGGNNSTFACRVLSSTGTDTYSAIAAGIGSLKGPKHGGANIKVMEMFEDLKRHCPDWQDEDALRAYLEGLLRGEGFDHTGLIYGMGHAVYSVSDPRAVILKSFVEQLSSEKGCHDEYQLYATVERLAGEVIAKNRKIYKGVCANVDFYSGFVYRMLGLPVDLFTPIFAIARIAGWSAHRMEELINCRKIIRPEYLSVSERQNYVPLEKRF